MATARELAAVLMGYGDVDVYPLGAQIMVEINGIDVPVLDAAGTLFSNPTVSDDPEEPKVAFPATFAPNISVAKGSDHVV